MAEAEIIKDEDDAPIKKGDTVRLKSGGPKMTVINAGDSGFMGAFVACVWFEGAKKFDDTFPPEALDKF